MCEKTVGPREKAFTKKERLKPAMSLFPVGQKQLQENMKVVIIHFGFSSKSQVFLGYNIGVIYLLESLGRKLCRCLFGFCLVAWNYENCPACFATADQVVRGSFSFHLYFLRPSVSQDFFWLLSSKVVYGKLIQARGDNLALFLPIQIDHQWLEG